MTAHRARGCADRVAAAACRTEIVALLFCFASVPGECAESEGPSIHDTVEYHDISGDTEQALTSALKQLPYAHASGDHFFSGYTHWNLHWSFRVESSGGLCRLASTAVELDVDMNLPRWKASVSAAPDLVKHWNTFAAALRKHEDGHREIAVSAAHEIETRTGKIPPTRDCDSLKKNLSRTAESTLREFRDKENSYDVTTLHGRTQGATFP